VLEFGVKELKLKEFDFSLYKIKYRAQCKYSTGLKVATNSVSVSDRKVIIIIVIQGWHRI
jgi:hypothetical protein